MGRNRNTSMKTVFSSPHVQLAQKDGWAWCSAFIMPGWSRPFVISRFDERINIKIQRSCHDLYRTPMYEPVEAFGLKGDEKSGRSVFHSPISRVRVVFRMISIMGFFAGRTILGLRRSCLRIGWGGLLPDKLCFPLLQCRPPELGTRSVWRASPGSFFCRRVEGESRKYWKKSCLAVQKKRRKNCQGRFCWFLFYGRKSLLPPWHAGRGLQIREWGICRCYSARRFNFLDVKFFVF